MIPYFEQPALHLGPLSFHAFGVLTALAVLVGAGAWWIGSVRLRSLLGTTPHE